MRSILALLLVLSMVLSFAACTPKDETQVPTDIVNGDFEAEHENNQWTGWTRSDAAFNVRGLISDEKLNGAVMEKSGNFYFSGVGAGNQTMRGTLTSDVFKLGGNSFITFKMGAAKNTEKVYVEFIEDGTNTVLAKVVNEDCDGLFITDHLITKIVDLSAHIGKNIYIKVTDNDDGTDFSYINLDAFKVCTTDAEVEAARTDYARQIEAYGEKPFEEDPTSIVNGGFESGNLAGWPPLVDNWGRVEGHATGVISAATYWGENLPYNQAGDYHMDGWNNGIGEPEAWQLQSTNFVLSGSGFISVRMGGNAASVRVYLADGTEIGYYKQNRFADVSFPNVGPGNGSWADMGTYVMDLSDYIGQEMYIVLCDEVIDAGWAHGFFDKVVTYYETAPDYAN